MVVSDLKSVNDKIRINTRLPRHAVLIHPMEMRQGGLCNVEKRIFLFNNNPLRKKENEDSLNSL